jgi:hypothetical protein
MARDRFKAMAMMVRVSIYREMKAAHQAGKHETPMRPFLDEKERLGARKCCNTVCRKPSHYVQYFLDIDGRIALCKYHGEKSIEQTKRNQSETV